MKSLVIVILLNISFSCVAQDEASATVSAISNNVLYLNNCNDETGSFRVNQKVIIIQKNGGAVVMNAIAAADKNQVKQVARKYVVLTITEVERIDNIVTAIKVSRDLQNSFNINNSSVVDVRVVTCKYSW